MHGIVDNTKLHWDAWLVRNSVEAHRAWMSKVRPMECLDAVDQVLLLLK